jgi:hypothetical protein
MKTKNNSQEEFAKNDGVEFPDTKSLKEKEQTSKNGDEE